MGVIIGVVVAVSIIYVIVSSLYETKSGKIVIFLLGSMLLTLIGGVWFSPLHQISKNLFIVLIIVLIIELFMKLFCSKGE